MNRRLLSIVALALVIVLAASCGGIKYRYYLNEANKLYKSQDYEKAVDVYKKILAFEPNDWTVNYQIAVSYLALYHPGSTHPKDVAYSEKGIEQLEKLLRMQPPDAETLEKVRGFYVGLLQAANKTDKALEFYESLIAKNPNDVVLVSQIAEMYFKKGDFANALKYYERRTQIESGNKEAWYTLGVICWARSYKGGPTVSDEERRAIVNKGLKALERALKLDPEYFEALSYTNLLYREEAKVLANAGDLEAAQASINKANEFTKKAMDARKKQLAAAKGKAA